MITKVYFSKNLLNKFVDECKANYLEGKKSGATDSGYTRGIFVTRNNMYYPTDYYVFHTNDRMKDHHIISEYESYGSYYKKHKGYTVNAFEMCQIEEKMIEKGEDICGSFHVHIDFPACPTKLDVEMFYKSVIDVDNVWCLILSFLDPKNPDLKIYTFENKLIREIEVVVNEV